MEIAAGRVEIVPQRKEIVAASVEIVPERLEAVLQWQEPKRVFNSAVRLWQFIDEHAAEEAV